MRLDVNVIGAKGLPKLNPKFPQKPYCVVQIQDIETSFQTKISTNATNPEWNESFSFTDLSDSPITISFTIYNKEKVISSNNFNLSNLVAGAQLDDWYELTPENQSKTKPKSGGKIHFSIIISAEPKDIESAIEEEEEDKENGLMSPQSTSQQFLSSSSPKINRARTNIEHYNGDFEQIENEANEAAEQKYNSFLQATAAELLNNSKVVKKMRESQEE